MPVCQAIQSRHLIALRYGDGWRLVEPGVHGHTADGREMLSAYQHRGASASNHSTGWKLFRVAVIDTLEVLDVALLAPRRGVVHSPPTGLIVVHCTA